MARTISPKIAVGIFTGTFVLALIAAVVFYWFFKPEKPIIVHPQPAPVLTEQAIQEALSKKADLSDIKLLTEKQISESLGKKVPLAERPGPLTSEEIKKALEAK